MDKGVEMVQHVMLNNIAHKDLRVITRFGAEFGDNVGHGLIVPTEYADVQREYPIFFRKDPATGEFMSVALLGLQKDENLFLDERGGLEGVRTPTTCPAWSRAVRFSSATSSRKSTGRSTTNPVIHVDLEHPRISKTEGEPLFLPQGGNTRYLDRIADC